jgi:hypothetical protein
MQVRARAKPEYTNVIARIRWAKKTTSQLYQCEGAEAAAWIDAAGACLARHEPSAGATHTDRRACGTHVARSGSAQPTRIEPLGSGACPVCLDPDPAGEDRPGRASELRALTAMC